jgi:hypothetical protein
MEKSEETLLHLGFEAQESLRVVSIAQSQLPAKG